MDTVGGGIGRIFSDGAFWNDTVDASATNSLLVHSFTRLVLPCRPVSVSYSLGTGALQIYIRSQ